MNVLWDFRLYSYAYATRGVGTYTRACARALLRRKGNNRLFIWGNRQCVPRELYDDTCEWIAYDEGTWKSDLLAVPAIVRRHRIDVFHYWVALGPIHRIGLGLFHGRCRAIATIHDLGVALWPGVPFLEHIRTTPYWRIQRLLFRRVRHTVCNSRATQSDVVKVFPRMRGSIAVVYPPLASPAEAVHAEREPYFVTLGGAPNKNLDTVLRAFAAFREGHPQYRLMILGEIEKEEEIRAAVPEGVVFEPMTSYTTHLTRSSGLVFCSRNEGLGLPPLEAMSRGCPVLLSDIPSHREIAATAACFVSPDDAGAIGQGMVELSVNRPAWERRAQEGWKAYGKLARDSVAGFDAYFSHDERSPR